MWRLFLVYGVLILGLFTYANYRGWSLTRYDEVKGVPKSVRNNPGAYGGYQRYYHK